MTNSVTKRNWLLIALALTGFVPCILGQSEKPWQLPEALRPDLDSRLNAFTEAQANGDWNQVEQLLGRYRRGGSYLLYTPSHRSCLIEVMRRYPMISFQYTVWDKSFSSEILSTPPERRWWTLVGEATIREDAKEIKKQIYLVAYRDQGNWYFTPPPFDNATAASHFTPEQLATDLQDKVVLRVAPDSPLRVVNLHVFTDSSNVMSRKIKFRLRNSTGKRVTGYTYRISDSTNDGDTVSAIGAQKDWIEPWAESREFDEDDVTGYYWCEGQKEVQTIIEIQDVRFEDGSKWAAPEAPDPNQHN
jgi:hypothetical protein